MLDIIGKKKIYFLISLMFIIPGLISMSIWGLRLSIDFTGGSRMILLFPKNIDQKIENDVKNIFQQEKIELVSLAPSDNKMIIRTKAIDEKQNAKLIKILGNKIKDIKQDEFETIGPTIGQETTSKAIQALALAAVLIILYIAWSFRSVPKPTSSWKFGVCAIIALVHDVLIVLGVFSILGHTHNVEIDSLFITALLTIIGFSVHDTIVIFDRIRENLRLTVGLPFSQIVNNSILQTITRSLNTSITTMLVLFTLLIFGGDTLTWFLVALLVGITSGVYSSIFNAASLLVLWNELEAKQKKTV